MTRVPRAMPSYHGKIHAADDFIDSPTADQPLVRRLHDWIAECMARLGDHDGWQAAYDTAGPIDILVTSTAGDSAVSAVCMPSQDRTGRHFPLIACARSAGSELTPSTSEAPLEVALAWLRFQHDLLQLQAADDYRSLLKALGGTAVPPSPAPATLAAINQEYLETELVETLDGLLATAGHSGDTISTLAALHPLLRAISRRPRIPICRGLVLPLPADPLRRTRVAAFWMSQVAGYLARRDVELVIMLTTPPSPRMILSFDATRGYELVAALMPDRAAGLYVDLTRERTASRDQLPLAVSRTANIRLSRLSEAFRSHTRSPAA